MGRHFCGRLISHEDGSKGMLDAISGDYVIRKAIFKVFESSGGYGASVLFAQILGCV